MWVVPRIVAVQERWGHSSRRWMHLARHGSPSRSPDQPARPPCCGIEKPGSNTGTTSAELLALSPGMGGTEHGPASPPPRLGASCRALGLGSSWLVRGHQGFLASKGQSGIVGKFGLVWFFKACRLPRALSFSLTLCLPHFEEALEKILQGAFSTVKPNLCLSESPVLERGHRLSLRWGRGSVKREHLERDVRWEGLT